MVLSVLPEFLLILAAKHAVLGITRSAALEFAQQGIRVNAIGPGYVDTPRMQQLPNEVRQWMASTHPMKRMATRKEVANMVAFYFQMRVVFQQALLCGRWGIYCAVVLSFAESVNH